MLKAVGRAIISASIVSIIVAVISAVYFGGESYEQSCTHSGMHAEECSYEHPDGELPAAVQSLQTALIIWEICIFFLPCFVASLGVGLWYEQSQRKVSNAQGNKANMAFNATPNCRFVSRMGCAHCTRSTALAVGRALTQC